MAEKGPPKIYILIKVIRILANTVKTNLSRTLRGNPGLTTIT
jgi:hypothetical protein